MTEDHVLSTNAAVAEVQSTKTIPLMELFGPTIQGEGNVIGQQTYFLRFGLCDYRCRMCDSLHAVIPALVKAQGRRLTQQQIFEEFWEFRHPNSTNWVTFSGGNPAIHDLNDLLNMMHRNKILVNVETQGTKYHQWLNYVDNLTISPKGPGMGETHDHVVFTRFLDQLDQHHYEYGKGSLYNRCFKIVVFDERDLQFARDIFRFLVHRYPHLNTDTQLYLSLGNPNPPEPKLTGGEEDAGPQFNPEEQLKQYRLLQEEICRDPILSKVRFLPQWHAFVWGNEKGK